MSGNEDRKDLVGPPANFRDLVRRQRARVRAVDVEELLASIDPNPLPPPPPRRLSPEMEARFAYWEFLTVEDIWGPAGEPWTRGEA